MDESIITNPGEIILVKIGKEKQDGFYARVNNIITDHKPGWWIVNFSPLIPTKDFKLIEVKWILDNQQIRGQEFTMGKEPEIYYQLFKVEFSISEKTYQDADAPVPITKSDKKSHLTLVK